MNQELKQASHEIRLALTDILENHRTNDTPEEWRRWYLGRISPFGVQAVLMEAYTFAEREMGFIPESISARFCEAMAALQALDDAVQAEVRK